MEELKQFSHLSMDSEKRTMPDFDTNHLSKISLDDAHSKEDLKNKQDKREMRKSYAKRTFSLTCIWLTKQGKAQINDQFLFTDLTIVMT